jgi:hypothetical protein
MKTLNLEQMRNVNGGIRSGCGDWVYDGVCECAGRGKVTETGLCIPDILSPIILWWL